VQPGGEVIIPNDERLDWVALEPIRFWTPGRPDGGQYSSLPSSSFHTIPRMPEQCCNQSGRTSRNDADSVPFAAPPGFVLFRWLSGTIKSGVRFFRARFFS